MSLGSKTHGEIRPRLGFERTARGVPRGGLPGRTVINTRRYDRDCKDIFV